MKPQKPTAAKRQNRKGCWNLNSNNKATKAMQRTRENGPVRARSRELQPAGAASGDDAGTQQYVAPSGRTHSARETTAYSAPLPRGHPRAVAMRFATSLLGLDVDGNSNVQIWMICLYSHENMEKKFYFI